MAFEPVDQQPSFPQIEENVLRRWRERDVVARALASRPDGPIFSVYEGPPTANGRPGVHHVPARTFKDLFPRYRAMKGYRVPRHAGWDCHGIPVEVEVERELGFTRKREIEEFGVAEFNARCRESVQRYVEDWVRLTERIGYWVDFRAAYWTMHASYVESVWWSLQALWDQELMYEGHKVVPYCPRCGTPLSDHEVALGYAEAEDPSVYVRFPVLEGPLADESAALVVWTTTPWTLISNTAVAVGRRIRYVLVDAGEHGKVVLAADLVDDALGAGARVLRDVAVDELEGMHYQGPFSYLSPEEDWRYVTVADFVTTTEGTGIVHLAPAFGADDLAVAREHSLPVVNPVDAEGRFGNEIPDFAGQFVKDADEHIIADLERRRLLLRSGTYRHTYPFCWRCDTPLLYYAKPSWYIATTSIRDRMLEVNAGVDWHPEHIRDGRYGNWLENNVDWAISRERYWGTPLPIWRCDGCEACTCVGSRAELGELAGENLSDLDPHRPYVDAVTFPCPVCGTGTARRVPEVIDAWYDSGAMPFAQFGYPHVAGSDDEVGARFPAHFICEGLDQTRGWFYSLMASSTLLFDRNSYGTVLCLGIVVDAEGKKMSKSRGNVVDPWRLCASHGADALRWLLVTGGSPWGEQRVGTEPLDEVMRRFLLTLWNTVYFFATYARLDAWSPGSSVAPAPRERPVLDRWILAELADLVGDVDARLERYDATGAGRRIQGFVDDLSNWYVRRSRRRFWAAEDSPDKHAAFATLYECLTTLSRLLAPFTPFVADELWERLVLAVDPDAPDSVHLADFPEARPEDTDTELREPMRAARRITELGRRARNDARVGVRQPLRTALVTLPEADRSTWPLVADVVAEELNVKAIEVPERSADLVTYRLKPNFRELGPVFGARTKQVAAALAEADAEPIVQALAHQGQATVDVGGEELTVTAAQVEVLEEARTGWQVAQDGPYSLALDLDIDVELRAEGLARELVRAVNDVRKREGLELADRIVLQVDASAACAAAVEQHADWIAGEVLATEVRVSHVTNGHLVELGGGEEARVHVERSTPAT